MRAGDEGALRPGCPTYLSKGGPLLKEKGGQRSVVALWGGVDLPSRLVPAPSYPICGMASSVGERVHRVRRTVLQMLRDRGYMVDQTDIDQSEDDFFEQHGNSPQRDSLTLLVQKRDDPTDQIFVFWPEDPKVGVKPIKRYMERMNEEDVKRAILVVQQNMTAFARQAMAEIQSAEGLILEQFQESELLVNITEHTLVPQHTVLTKAVRRSPLSHHLAISGHAAAALLTGRLASLLLLLRTGKAEPAAAIQDEGGPAAAHTARRPRLPLLWAREGASCQGARGCSPHTQPPPPRLIHYATLRLATPNPNLTTVRRSSARVRQRASTSRTAVRATPSSCPLLGAGALGSCGHAPC